MLLSKVHRGPRQGEIKRLHFQDFDGTGESGGGWSSEPGEFVPAGTTPRKIDAPSRAAAPQVDPEAIRQEAFAQGRKAGQDECEARFGRSAEALARGLEEVSRLRESLLSGSSHDMLRLVMTVARQVIQTEISVKQELVLKTIERALQAAVQADCHHIRVHPDDLALVKEKKPLFLASINGLQNIIFEADPSIAPGGCRLESELGEVDATIDGQLEEIRRTLASALEER